MKHPTIARHGSTRTERVFDAWRIHERADASVRDRLGDPERRRSPRVAASRTASAASPPAPCRGALTPPASRPACSRALEPPLGRTLLLAKLVGDARDRRRERIDARHQPLDERRGRPAPATSISSRSGSRTTIPAWVWAIGDTRLEKRRVDGARREHHLRPVPTAPPPRRRCDCACRRSSTIATPRRAARARRVDARGRARHRAACGSRRYDGATPLWLAGARRRDPSAPRAGIAASRSRVEARARRSRRARTTCSRREIVRPARSPATSSRVVASTRRDAGTGVAAPLALVSALARRRAHERSLARGAGSARSRRSRGTAPAWVRQLGARRGRLHRRAARAASTPTAAR